MNQFHVVCGLPRSGSTLLCNLLNQHPKIYASSTSHVPHALAMLTTSHTRSPELKSSAIREHTRTLDRLRKAMRGYIDGWYDGVAEIVVDKSRLWNSHLQLLSWLDPSIRAIICVRDLRSVFASIEQRHVETPMFDEADNILQKTLTQRAETMFSPEGIIGSPLIGIEDAIKREPENKLFLRYEDLVRSPRHSFDAIYKFLDLPFFEHDFEHVENVAEDVDALYHFKYPHEGCGKVQPSNDSSMWERWVDPILSIKILNRYPLFYQTVYPNAWKEHENRLQPNPIAPG